MSVRRRSWQNRDGTRSEAWVVGYTDRAGVRRLKTFERKRDAEVFEAAVALDVRAGIHVPDSQSIVVAEAA
ncbi:MAG: site-specific integrase, partial [Pseudolabrys sp.]